MNSLLLLIFIIFLFILANLIPHFQNKKEQFSNSKSPAIQNALQQLKKIPSGIYKPYFTPIRINDFRGITGTEGLKKIFVSIASYRDVECNATLKNLIRTADEPKDLHLVICQQNSIVDKDCVGFINNGGAKITIERLLYTQALGPNYARWRIQQHWKGEEYYLQIDSHTRMIPHWDSILKTQLSLCPSDKPILTQYPLDYKHTVSEHDRDNEIAEEWEIHKLRGPLYISHIDPDDEFTRIQSDYTEHIQRVPFESAGLVSGFIFTKGNFVKDVKLDPYLYLFFGEQMDHTIRAWCAGYDFYSPTKTVIFHIYERDHRPTYWELSNQKPLEILSRIRLYYKLGRLMREEIPKEYHYILTGLLNEDYWTIHGPRTLKEYQEFANVK